MLTKVRTSPRLLLLAGAAASLVLALLVLLLSADRSPTTLDTGRLFGLWRARHATVTAVLLLIAVSLMAATARHRMFAFASCALAAMATILTLEVVGAMGLVSWSRQFDTRFRDLAAYGTAPAPFLDVKGTTNQDTASLWGLESDPVRFHYRTDRYGFRNEPDRADADVYLIGDSMLVGALVPFKETLVARLEARLRRPVMQLALINVSPQREHQLFREAGLKARNRVVIQFIFEGNDLLDSRRFRQPAAPSAVSRGGTLTNQLWLRAVAATQPPPAVVRQRTCSIADQLYTFLWARNAFEGVEGEAAVITEAIARFADEVRRDGGRFLTVFIPSKLRVLAPFCTFPPGSELADTARHLGPLREHMHAWSKATGHDLLDLTEPLQSSARAGQIPWLWGDTHWNAVGHAVAAEAVAGWKPLREVLGH